MPVDQPNIPLIMADDIGWSNIGAYHRGMLGGETPNIDRIMARQLRDSQS